MDNNITGIDFKTRQVAARIRELREAHGFTPEEMASRTDLSVEEYLQHEQGNRNLNIAFLYRCTLILGVDLGDLLEGHSPKLRSYALTRKGDGQRIEEAHHMVGYNLAAGFRNRIALPLYHALAFHNADGYAVARIQHGAQKVRRPCLFFAERPCIVAGAVKHIRRTHRHSLMGSFFINRPKEYPTVPLFR